MSESDLAPTSIEVAAPGEPSPRPRRGAFRALAHRNYRLFFFGQMISVVGTWMQDTALSLLVLRLYQNP